MISQYSKSRIFYKIYGLLNFRTEKGKYMSFDLKLIQKRNTFLGYTDYKLFLMNVRFKWYTQKI